MEMTRTLCVYICKYTTLFCKNECIFKLFPNPLSDILLTSPDFGFIMLNKKRPDSVDNPLSGLNTACCRFVNSLLFREFVGYFAELFRRQFELFAVEIHVVFALNGDQMNVCMGHFEA